MWAAYVCKVCEESFTWMESRLQAVLRVGEAHRQTVRTGALEMSDLPDDALRWITRALASGNEAAACHAVRKWCDLQPRHRAMCRDGGDALWNELTTRVFGANSIGVAHATDSQKNFYELCRRAVLEAARNWMRVRHPGTTFTTFDLGNNFLFVLAGVLALLDEGGRETSEKRVRLVGMLQLLHFHHSFSTESFTNADLLHLFSMDQLYAMVESDQNEEIDAALELLKHLANDMDTMDESWHKDNREGYLPDKIPRLKQLLRGATDEVRKENILRIWDGLMFNDIEIDDEDRTDDQGRYARALLRADVERLVMDYAMYNPNHNLRHYGASIMKNIAHCLNASLTQVMHDASGPHGGPRSGLVYGTD